MMDQKEALLAMGMLFKNNVMYSAADLESYKNLNFLKEDTEENTRLKQRKHLEGKKGIGYKLKIIA